MRKRNEEFSLKELINIFIPKLWLILIVALVFGSVMAVYSAILKDDTYTSTTRIHVTKSSTNNNYDYAVNDVDFANSYLETYKIVLSIPDFYEGVKDRMKTDSPDKYLEKNWESISLNKMKGYVSCETQQDVLKVSVTTGDPLLSAAIADAIAKIFTATDSTEQVLAYPAGVMHTKIIQPPHSPTSPNSRNVLMNTAIGAIVGAVLAMAFVFILNMFDIVIHDKKKIQDTFDIPILGVIPRFLAEEGKSKK